MFVLFNILITCLFFLQDVFVVGGHIKRSENDRGNVFTVPANEYADFNMFLDPLAAKIVIESELNITLIPLSVQRRVSSFSKAIERLRRSEKTPEAIFSLRLLSTLQRLQRANFRYQHMVKSPLLCMKNATCHANMSLVVHLNKILVTTKAQSLPK